ncbi:Glutamate receptor ionotropic, kainate 4-like 4, partial [Homarus americanus]
TASEGEQVWVYRRCLYCKKGEAQVQLLYQGNVTSGLQHRINLFPEFKEPGTPVAPRDSLNTRMLHTFANNLNFSYVLREPLDEKWGTPAADGNWTGIVGTLQHQQADFSLDLTLTESRSRVMDHSRIYNYDPYIILSLKPSSLPRHLALTRPFK